MAVVNFNGFSVAVYNILVICLKKLSMPGKTLHGPTMFAVKAKIYGVLYKQSISFAFDETSSYWSAPKNSEFLGFSLVTTR